jgi:hypothetical protein
MSILSRRTFFSNITKRNQAKEITAMNRTHEVEQMCVVAKGSHHGPAPILEEGRWVKA